MPYLSHVQINIYNILGKEIVSVLDRYVNAGYQEIRYNALNLTSGIYFYSMIYEDKQITKKFILVK